MTDEAEFHTTKRIIQAALDEYARSDPRPSGQAVAEAFASATLAMWRVVHEDRGLNELQRFLSQADTIARSTESNR